MRLANLYTICASKQSKKGMEIFMRYAHCKERKLDIKIFSQIINTYKKLNISANIKNIMSVGIKICFVLTLFATFILSLYITCNPSIILYVIGSNLFKSSTTFMAIFFIFGIAFNTIKGELS